MILPSKTQTALSFWTVSSLAVIFFYHSFLTIYCQSLCLAALSFSCYTNKFTLWPYIEHITTSYTIHQKIFKWVVNLILFNMSTNYCDTCQKSDCACIYSICLNHRPLNQTPLLKNPGKQTGKTKIGSVAIRASFGHTPIAQVWQAKNSR